MKTGKNIFEYGFTLIEVIITLVVVAVVAAMIAIYFGTSYTQSSVPISRLMAAGNLNQIMEKITGDYNNAPTTWSPGTAYTSGTAPPTVVLPTEANRNGYQYICSVAGTSGATEPTWNNATTIGATISGDGGVTWTNGGLIPPNAWAASTAYTKYAVVYPANGYEFICTAPGTSGTAQPSWPTTIGSTVSDGTVTWTCYQPLVALQTKIGSEGQEYTKIFNGVSISYRVIQNRFITFGTTNTENDSCTPTSCNMYGVNVYGRYLKVTIGLPTTASPTTADTLTTLFVRR